jgi:hypothetical protein
MYSGLDSNKSYRGLDGNEYFKLGISSNIKARKYFYNLNNGVDNYITLREFPNRRQAGLCEYLASLKFATIGEACPIENKEDYINFVYNFDYDKEKELIRPYLEKYYPEDLK